MIAGKKFIKFIGFYHFISFKMIFISFHVIIVELCTEVQELENVNYFARKVGKKHR